MEQPMVNERAGERNVSDRLEGIEDELQLLKSEVKQTLIDLREFLMKGSAMSITSTFIGPAASSSGPAAPSANGQVSAAKHQESPSVQEPPAETKGLVTETPEVQDPTPSPVSAAERQDAGEAEKSGPVVPQPGPMTPQMPFPQAFPAPLIQSVRADGQGKYSIDAIKMGHIIKWLGTVARKGLTSSHLKPFLEAYEQSGHLTSEMAVLTYRSLEHLEYAIGRSHQTFSTVEYSDCLLELHEIICNPGYEPKDDSPVSRSHRG